MMHWGMFPINLLLSQNLYQVSLIGNL